MKGASLVMVLAVVSLAATLAFGLCAFSTLHLSFSATAERSNQAAQRAESAILAAAQRVCADPTWGTHPGDGLTLTGVQMTFDATVAARDHCPLSLNNMAGVRSQPGPEGLSVPPQDVLLAAQATAGQETRRMYAIFHFPPFNYALVSNQAMTLVRCHVNSVDPQDVGTGDPRALDPSKLLPAGVVANGVQADAVALQVSEVSGDVQSGGGVALDAQSRIDGEVRQNQDPATLPPVRFADFDLSKLGQGIQRLGPTLGDTTVEGLTDVAAGLQVTGTLTLHDGVVYVPGDLDVNGNVSGTGAIVVGGHAHFTGAINLGTSSLVALVARGDVQIQGQGTGTSLFRGLVCCEHDFDATSVALVGLYASQPPDGSTSIGMHLQDVNVYHDVRTITTDFPVQQVYNSIVNIADPVHVLEEDKNHAAHPQVGWYDSTGRLRQPGELVDLLHDVETFQILREWDVKEQCAKWYLIAVDWATGQPLEIMSVQKQFEGYHLSDVIRIFKNANKPIFGGLGQQALITANAWVVTTETHFHDDDPESQAAFRRFAAWNFDEFTSLADRCRVLLWR